MQGPAVSVHCLLFPIFSLCSCGQPYCGKNHTQVKIYATCNKTHGADNFVSTNFYKQKHSFRCFRIIELGIPLKRGQPPAAEFAVQVQLAMWFAGLSHFYCAGSSYDLLQEQTTSRLQGLSSDCREDREALPSQTVYSFS